MSKREPIPAYLEHFPCMQAPCVRHAAMMIEQAAYEHDGGVGLIVPDELFPPRPQHVGWRYAYRAELAANPRLASILNGNRGAEGVYDAAGLTAAQREALELRGLGLGVREIARVLRIGPRAAWERITYAERKFADHVLTLNSQPFSEGTMHAA